MNDTATKEITFTKIERGSHIDHMTAPTFAGGRYYYQVGPEDDIKTDTPWVGIDRTGSELRQGAFGTQEECFAFLRGEEVDGIPWEKTHELPGGSDENDPMAVLREANGNGTPKPADLPDLPNRAPVEPVNSVEFMAREYRTPAEARPTDLHATGQQIADNMVSEFGKTLAVYEPSAIAYGFPPAVDALITKANLDATRTSLVLEAFKNTFARLTQWREKALAIVVTDVAQTELIKEAKALHKIVRDERLNVEKRRKEVKEPALRECQLIDGVSNAYKDQLEPIETHLLKQAKFAEIREQERKDALAFERRDKLALFEFDASQMAGLGDMTPENFEIFYSGVRERYHAAKNAAEQEDRERRERERQQQIENERLRAENQRLEDERKAEAMRAAEQKRLADEAEAKRKAAQDELDRQDAERKAAEARAAEEAEHKRLAPDKEKLIAYAESITAVAMAVPDVDPKFAGLLSDVNRDLQVIVGRIQQAAGVI